MRIIFILILSVLVTCSEAKKEKVQAEPSAQLAEVEIEENETPGQYFMSKFDGVKYGENFKNFAYVNPTAPKGGTLYMATVGTFDKVNYFLLKGRASEALKDSFDMLMLSAKDEADSKYGLIVKSCEIAPDAAWVRFHIRQKARFSDGSVITSYAVKQTIETLQQDGMLPVYKRLYGRIQKIETPDDHTIILYFKPDHKGQYDPSNPLIMGNIIPLSPKSLAHLADNVLTPVIGSSPYVIKDFELGQFLHFTKTPCYWARNLPVCRGRWNFDNVRITYYKNDRALIEAFKKGDFDIHFFSDLQEFTAFKCPDHRFTKLNFKHKRPVQVQTIALNQNNPILKDQRIRDALNLVFSFKDINHVCFGDTALHARSLFENTGLGHKGLPDDGERAIFRALQHKIEPAFYQRLMETDVNYFSKGPKDTRLQLAEKLLDDAGFQYQKNLGCRSKTNLDGTQSTLEFNLMIRQSRSKFSRFLTIFKNDLEKIGIKINIIMHEESLYRQKEDAGDYDMMIMPYTMNLSPGVELLSYFGKMSGQQKGSMNYMNLVDDVVEALAMGAIQAKTQPELARYVKALDRYITLRGYVILVDYNNSLKLIYRNDRIDFPKNPMADINVWERGWSVI